MTIALANADPVAGIQFSVRGSGGFVWGAFDGSDRIRAAGMAVYQHRINDSTLNVVILAPYRSALPFGDGLIGQISFTIQLGAGTDTMSVQLNELVVCDANAQYLNASAERLVWNRQKSQGAKVPTFTLKKNYPNPFNPATTISYELEKPATVRLVIYDIAGRLISTLVSQYQQRGRYSVKWNAGGVGASGLTSGMYFARLQVDDQVAVNKMILAK